MSKPEVPEQKKQRKYANKNCRVAEPIERLKAVEMLRTPGLDSPPDDQILFDPARDEIRNVTLDLIGRVSDYITWPETLTCPASCGEGSLKVHRSGGHLRSTNRRELEKLWQAASESHTYPNV